MVQKVSFSNRVISWKECAGFMPILTGSNAGCGWEIGRPRERLRNRFYSGRSIPVLASDFPKDMLQVPLVQAELSMSEDDDPSRKVVLEVGLPGDTWKYSVDRQSLAEKSEWFRAMLVGPLAPPPSDPPPIVSLQHVDKRAFDHLFRYFRGEPIDFHSVVTARATLDAAHYYLCPELAKLAVDYLMKNLSSSTVLGVYHGLSLYAYGESEDDAGNRPSAPPPPDDDAGEIAAACTMLLSACLAVIDSYPDDILRQERFEELSVDEVEKLASRDELRLADESILFSALEKWAASECRTHGVEPTPCNKRAALSDEIWYSVRYLLMNDKEFIQGPMASGILSSSESAAIVARILGHSRKHRNEMMQSNAGLLRLSTTPRKRRSPVKNKSGMKPGKKERDDNKKNRRKECASQGQRACARVGDFVIRVLACVFD